MLALVFFKQKTAYEMRISDWSSDVCSSDLITIPKGGGELNGVVPNEQLPPDMRLGVAATPEEAAAKTAYLLDHGADFIKTIATGPVLAIGTEPGAPEQTEEQLDRKSVV